MAKIQPNPPAIPDLGNLGDDTPSVASTKDEELDRVLTADVQAPITPAKVAETGVSCPKCKKGTVSVYGMCIACYDKLKPVEKRKLLLMARVTGVNSHEYTPDAMRTWRLELELINSGHWKGPLKFTASKRPLGDIAS